MNTYAEDLQAAEAAPISLEIHICKERRSYTAHFATQEQALAFVEARRSTHAVFELKDRPIIHARLVGAEIDRLLDYLYPTCEHGMPGNFCSGPNHFGEPGDVGFM